MTIIEHSDTNYKHAGISPMSLQRLAQHCCTEFDLDILLTCVISLDGVDSILDHHQMLFCSNLSTLQSMLFHWFSHTHKHTHASTHMRGHSTLSPY
jgi:hypothetical protein